LIDRFPSGLEAGEGVSFGCQIRAENFRLVLMIHETRVMPVESRHRVQPPVHVDAEFGVAKPVWTMVVLAQ